jgi:hypothetical protein
MFLRGKWGFTTKQNYNKESNDKWRYEPYVSVKRANPTAGKNKPNNKAIFQI